MVGEERRLQQRSGTELALGRSVLAVGNDGERETKAAGRVQKDPGRDCVVVPDNGLNVRVVRGVGRRGRCRDTGRGQRRGASVKLRSECW
jgi:hypothetical protein